MKRILTILGLAAAVSLGVSSCSYREYAPAAYPDPVVYMPAAVDGIRIIDQESTRCSLSEDGRKLLIHLGVAVSGLERKDFPVQLSFARSKVNIMIEDGTFEVGTLPLPDAVCNIPDELVIPAAATSAPFDLAVQVNYLKDPEYIGRKFAVGVRVSSDAAEASSELDTVILLIDPSFL